MFRHVGRGQAFVMAAGDCVPLTRSGGHAGCYHRHPQEARGLACAYRCAKAQYGGRWPVETAPEIRPEPEPRPEQAPQSLQPEQTPQSLTPQPREPLDQEPLDQKQQAPAQASAEAEASPDP